MSTKNPTERTKRATTNKRTALQDSKAADNSAAQMKGLSELLDALANILNVRIRFSTCVANFAVDAKMAHGHGNRSLLPCLKHLLKTQTLIYS